MQKLPLSQCLPRWSKPGTVFAWPSHCVSPLTLCEPRPCAAWGDEAKAPGAALRSLPSANTQTAQATA